MKKRNIPEGVVALETYRWDFDREDYVLVKRKPVEREEEKQGEQSEDEK